MHMASNAGARAGRALRFLVLTAVPVLVIGGWTVPSVPPVAVVVAAGEPVERWPAALTAPAAADPARLRVSLPLGYDTAAARAARAAAEAAAAAAEAEAEQARVAAAAAARTTAPPGGGAARTEESPASGLPLDIDTGSSDQVVTVVASSAGASTATLTAWQRTAGGWTTVLGPVRARVGAAGVGRASESSTRTPAGTFTLTEAFGRAGNPGTALPYRVVDGDDWWVSDVHSTRYNQYAECAPGSCDFDEAAGENLAEEPAYAHAVVIDYNRGGTPGAGSAFFLHVSNGAATAGCVAIDAGSLGDLLRWLDPSARPLIAIGVG
jgi:L,D-peptidoglycan transpeptidase YkuD (ErfK/YbiS/YcfS/YnhG family)